MQKKKKAKDNEREKVKRKRCLQKELDRAGIVRDGRFCC
jgi:hypothetical protein